MNILDFSFLFPPMTDVNENKSFQNLSVIDDLGLSNLLYSKAVDISRYITDDCEIIEYRSGLFMNFAECEELLSLFVKIRDIIHNIHEINKVSNVTETNETNIYSIKQLELYINFIKIAHEGFSSLRKQISAAQIQIFADIIDEVFFSPEFNSLCNGTQKMLLSVANIKSVTVGFNINAQMEPYEGGLLSVNTEYIKSGNLVDRLMSVNLGDDKLTALCPLIPISKIYNKQEYDTASMIFIEAMKKTLRSGIGRWQPLIKNFLTSEMAGYISLLPELDYIIYGGTIVCELKKHKLPLCCPVVHRKEDRVCKITGLYNPIVALENTNIQQVRNDFCFDNDGMIYIVTGPNSGGKSVFTRAVGIIYVFLQMGLPIPAKKAELSPVDLIMTVFPNKAHGLSNAGGRLDEECIEIHELFKKVTPYSIVLLDEVLSSTSSFEGAIIAKELICALRRIGVRGLFTTHMHELVGMIDEINSEFDGGIDTLTTEVTNGKRTFLVNRRRPDGKSYALDVAKKHGLTEKTLLELNRNGKLGGI